MFKYSQDGLILTLKISPNAAKNEIIKSGEEVKVKLTAQPIEGKANKALIEYLAKLLKMPKTSIKILKGETSKEKTLLFQTNDVKKIELINSLLAI